MLTCIEMPAWDCTLKNPPDGGKVRPWEAMGMSRATWYRRGKPTHDFREFMSQRGYAERNCSSTRSAQRVAFAKRYGIPELAKFELEKHFLRPAQLEPVAKWPHEWQADFVKAMVALMDQCPKKKDVDEDWMARDPIMARCAAVGGKMVRKLATMLIRE